MRQSKSESAAFLHALVAMWNPVGPTMWWPMAERLSRAPGWMPSMLLVAMTGVAFFVNSLFGRWFNGPLATVMTIATWLTWGLVSCLAMSIGWVDSVRNIRRLGAGSILRFRIWFELGRLSWHAAVFGFVVAAGVSFVADALNANAIDAAAWSTGKIAVASLLTVFAVSGAIGYVVALVRWRIPTGRAFECVNFFLPLAAACYLIILAHDRWPPAAIWPDGVVSVAAGLLGIAVFATGFIISIYQMQQWETRAKL